MIENKDNRIQRLSYILTQLSKCEKLSTIKLAEQFETTTRKIQLDFKEYILPLFDEETDFKLTELLEFNSNIEEVLKKMQNIKWYRVFSDDINKNFIDKNVVL